MNDLAKNKKGISLLGGLMKLVTASFIMIITLLICLFVSACVTDQAATNSRGAAPAKTTRDMYHPPMGR
jgi:hypothetical protein